MVALPTNVMEQFNDKASTKILGTKSDKGDVHMINVGGAGAVDPETIFVGEIIMKASSENLRLAQKDGSKCSILVTKGMEAYEVRCSVKGYQSSGPMFDQMKAQFKAMGYDLRGVWLLKPEEVWNESPAWTTSRKMV